MTRDSRRDLLLCVLLAAATAAAIIGIASRAALGSEAQDFWRDAPRPAAEARRAPRRHAPAFIRRRHRQATPLRTARKIDSAIALRPVEADAWMRPVDAGAKRAALAVPAPPVAAEPVSLPRDLDDDPRPAPVPAPAPRPIPTKDTERAGKLIVLGVFLAALVATVAYGLKPSRGIAHV